MPVPTSTRTLRASSVLPNVYRRDLLPLPSTTIDNDVRALLAGMYAIFRWSPVPPGPSGGWSPVAPGPLGSWSGVAPGPGGGWTPVAT